MGTELVISTEVLNGKSPVTLLHIQGNIDTNTSQQFQDAASAVYKNGARNLLLDMSKVEYISSAGLRALHTTYNMFREPSEETDEKISQGLRDGSYKASHLKLLGPSKKVQEVLKIAGFDMYIESFADLKAALASF